MTTKVQTETALGAFALGAVVSIAYRCDLLSKQVTGVALAAIGTTASAIWVAQTWGTRTAPDPELGPKTVNPESRPRFVDEPPSDDESDPDSESDLGPRPVSSDSSTRLLDDSFSDEESDSEFYSDYDSDPDLPIGASDHFKQILPDELLLHAFSYCEVDDLIRSQQVCWQFHEVGKDVVLWKQLWRRDFPQFPLPRDESLKQDYLLQRLTHNNIASGATPKEIILPVDNTWRVSWSPNGQQLIARMEKRRDSKQVDDLTVETISLFQVGSWERQVTLDQSLGLHQDYHCLPDGRMMAIPAAQGRSVQVCSAESGATIVSLLTGGSDRVNTVAWSPNSRQLVTSSGRGVIRIWSTENWAYIEADDGGGNRGNSIAWSPNGQQFVMAGGSREGLVYAANSGRIVQRLAGHTSYVECVAWSPDGRLIVTGARDQTTRVWDVETWECIQALAGCEGRVSALSWSPDGSRLLVTSEGNRFKGQLWNTETWECVTSIKWFKDPAKDEICWSPNGLALVLRTESGMQVWLAETGMLAVTVESPCHHFEHASWSPDGRSIMTCAYDGKVRLYDFSPEV